MSEAPSQKPTTWAPIYKEVSGEACFQLRHYFFASMLCFPQVILIRYLATHGYGYEYLLSLVLLTNLWIYVHIRRYLDLGNAKTLNLFSILKGYPLLVALFYNIPMMLAAIYEMLAASGSDVSKMFFDNNKSLVELVAGLNLPGKRPMLDLAEPKNVLNIYYLALVYIASTLSLVMGLLLVPVKVRAWLQLMQNNPPESFGPTRRLYMFLVAAACSVWLLSLYWSKFTYGYEMLPSGQLSSDFDPKEWRHQVQGWALIGAVYSTIISTAIACAASFFIKKPRD
ncbi:MAG: hypothetical protein ACK4PK_08600 [Alphaproteobacteria bacterium]